MAQTWLEKFDPSLKFGLARILDICPEQPLVFWLHAAMQLPQSGRSSLARHLSRLNIGITEKADLGAGGIQEIVQILLLRETVGKVRI